MTSLKRLGDVLASAEDLPWNFALYLPAGAAWDASTLCAVLDPDDVDDEEEDDEPAFARENGLKYALDVASVQDIVENAKQQMPSIDTAGLVKALVHYHRHDAFVDLTRQVEGK